MPSTYSTNLALELIGTGDQAGVWGNTTNTNLGTLIEQAISGYVTQAVSTGTDTTITIPNGATGVARNMYIELTGTGGASTNLIVPANKKLYFIFNNTSSGQVTVKVSGQTGVSVPNKAKMILVSNGTDIVDATNYIGNISAASANITVLTSASATITNLLATSLTVSSGSTLNGGVVINEPGADADTRIEGDTDANLFFVDASANNVGIGTSSPANKLQVVASTSGTNDLVTISRFDRATSGTAANGLGGRLEFSAQDNAGSQRTAAFINWGLASVASGSPTGFLSLSTRGTDPALYIDNSGNLGLGVTPSAWALSGSAALQVKNAGFFGYNNDAYVFANTYVDSGGGTKYIANGFASYYHQTSGEHRWITAASGTAGGTVSGTQAMTLDASGKLYVGGTTGGERLNLENGGTDSTGVRMAQTGTGGRTYFVGSTGSGYPGGAGALVFYDVTASAERARITSDGNFGIGTTSPSNRLTVSGANTASRGQLSVVGASADGRITLYSDSTFHAAFAAASTDSYIGTESNTPFRFITNGTERARITSGGILGVGVTNPTGSTADAEGIQITPTYILANRSGNAGLGVNRKTNDGDLVVFYQADDLEGSISVSGNTVSYNAFAGSHWSQLQDGSKPDILRGTVMESINELCVWPDEQNERLPKSKISDTAGSKKVYGVFMAWDNDWTATNDMYVTAVGAFICRVNASVTVQEGDLLESNGDGTARVQADDIIRSSTIGKVTSTVKTHQYDDGSYCVPTVLYCG